MGFRRVGRDQQVLVALFATLALAACGAETDDGGTAGMVAQTGGVGGGVAGSGGGVSGQGGVSGMGAPVANEIPCAVKQIITTQCGACHGAQTIGGAPMSLVTLADFQKDHPVVSPLSGPFKGTTMKVHEIVKVRVNQEMGTSAMPPGGQMPQADLDMLNAWLAGGAQGGMGCSSTGGVGGDVMGGAGGMGMTGGAGGMTGGAGGQGGTGAMGQVNLCDASDSYEPLVARPGETCYEFLTHGGGFAGDPFMVPLDESYNQLYYEIPWGADEIATRFGADFDNLEVLHHWLGFETNAGSPGQVSRDVTGTTLGETAKLFGGWAVGGCNIEFPEDTALDLPDPNSGKVVMIQWHHYNFTGVPQADASKIQICTVPTSARANVAGLTWLGTENFNSILGMPPGVESKFDGTCLNETSAPITIIGFWPHMHEIGTHMYTEVIPAAGGNPMQVFSEPFKFDAQYAYIMNPRIVLQPGDKVRAECTFFNNTAASVAFGQSTKQEMCYQFAFSYPAGALDKPENLSLIGATNTCWGD
jgi:hypothetical protein